MEAGWEEGVVERREFGPSSVVDGVTGPSACKTGGSLPKEERRLRVSLSRNPRLSPPLEDFSKKDTTKIPGCPGFCLDRIFVPEGKPFL